MVMLLGNEAVIRVIKRIIYNGFGVNAWVLCKKRSSAFALYLRDQGSILIDVATMNKHVNKNTTRAPVWFSSLTLGCCSPYG